MKRRLVTTVVATSVLALSVSSVAVAAPQQQQNRAKDGSCTAAATQSCDQSQQRLHDGTGDGSQSRAQNGQKAQAQNGQKAKATKRAGNGTKQGGSQALNRAGNGIQVRDGSCR